MNNKLIRYVLKYKWLLITVFAISYFIFLHLYSLTNLTQLEGDAVSRALPSVALVRNLGVPYKDYWEIAPPGITLINLLWMAVFSTSITSFKILHALFILISIFGMTRLFYKTLPKPIFAILSFFVTIVFLTSRVNSQFLPIELYALSFAMIGLNVLITEKWSYEARGLLAAFFIIFSGQIKEPFLLGIVAFLPFLSFIYIKHPTRFKKTLMWTITGIVLVVLVVVAPLLLTSTFHAYREVLQVKKEIFRIDQILNDFPMFFPQLVKGLEFPKLTFIYLNYSIFALILWSIPIYLFSKVKTKELGLLTKNAKSRQTTFFYNLSLTENLNNILVVTFYSIGIWLGISIQGRFSGHYDIPMVFPVFFLIAISIISIFSNLSRLLIKRTNKTLNFALLLLMTGVVLIFVFPNKAYFVEYPYKEARINNFIERLVVAQRAKLLREEAIISRTKHDECVIHVYGWSVGTTYFYSNRRPCTRFFLANILPEKYNKEYRESIINNPPAALVYTLGGADLDTEKFEREIFDYPAVLRECYQQDTKFTDLYWPKNKDIKERSACIKKVLIQFKQL